MKRKLTEKQREVLEAVADGWILDWLDRMEGGIFTLRKGIDATPVHANTAYSLMNRGFLHVGEPLLPLTVTPKAWEALEW